MTPIVNRIIAVFDRYMPEPLAFSLIMTMIALVVAWASTETGPVALVEAWGGGLSSLLTFTAQVCMTIMLAFGLAHLGPMPRFLERLSSIPRSTAGAYAFCGIFTGIVALICWPLGTILGGLMARQVAISCRERGIAIHYPLLGGVAFSGFVVWHMGYTGSAPLLVATEGNPMQDMLGGLIPITQTTLSPANLLTIAATLATIVLVAVWLTPPAMEPITDEQIGRSGMSTSADEDETPRPWFAGYIENARWPTTVAGLLLLGYVVNWFANEGIRLDLNLVNWTFLAACLLLSRSAMEMSTVLMNSGRAIIPTLLQYPLYGGVMGIMLASGLVEQIAGFFAQIGTATTLPVIAFLSGGLINLFIPSGGAQWAVQGPAFIEAAELLGTKPELIVLGVAYGDQWTNIIHPFVVIPFLIMSGLKANQVLSFSFIVFLAVTIPLAGGLFLAGVFG